MFFLTKPFISWILVLMVSFSSVQVSMAADFNPDSHGTNCQMTDMNKDCALNHDEHCQNHVSCVGHTSSFFQISSQTQLNISKPSSIKFTIDNERVQAQYPELLKRPPRS